MIRAVWFCLLFATVFHGETLEDAARGLAKRVSIRLAPGDAPRISSRNLSPLSSPDADKARQAFERALKRPPRPAHPVDVVFTVSVNTRGYLLISELKRTGSTGVDMVPYHPLAAVRSVGAILEKRLILEQDEPMLDLAIVEDRMLVLGPSRLAVYVRRETGWEQSSASVLENVPPVRDPRGRLQAAGSSFTAFLPGTICRGDWSASTLEAHCEPSDATFPLSGDAVRFSASRNTLEATGWPPFYAYGRSGDMTLLAEPDGQVHVYDPNHKSGNSIDAWGSDFAVLENGCAAGRVLANPGDSIRMFSLLNRFVVPASDPVSLPGAVTALWPSDAGATAIVHESGTGRYAAYSLTVDCGR